MESKQYTTKQKNHWKKNKEEIFKIPGDEWKGEHNDLKSMEWSRSSSNWKVYSDTHLPQEIRKISNNLTLHLKELKRREQTKIQTW